MSAFSSNLQCIPCVRDSNSMYQCKDCNKDFQTKRGCVRHELTHSVTFKCEKCGKQYRRAQSLRDHVKKSHHGDATRLCVFKCSKCTEAFANVRQLVLHNETQHRQIGGAAQTALNGAAEVKTLRPVGVDKYDLSCQRQDGRRKISTL